MNTNSVPTGSWALWSWLNNNIMALAVVAGSVALLFAGLTEASDSISEFVCRFKTCPEETGVFEVSVAPPALEVTRGSASASVVGELTTSTDEAATIKQQADYYSSEFYDSLEVYFRGERN